MKAVVQRAKRAQIKVNGQVVSRIGSGLVVFLCVEKGDQEKILAWFADKLVNLRVFSDEQGKFNLNLQDVGGEILLVSNFTVCGALKKGTRPSFHLAEEPKVAENKILQLKNLLEERGVSVRLGVFGAHMEVELINDGPVTIVLDRSAH